MIIFKIILGLLIALLVLFAAILVLLCLPVMIHIVFDSTSGSFELGIKYLLIPLRIFPKDERSVLVKFEKLSENIKHFKEISAIKIRNNMLMHRPTRWLYRKLEDAVKRSKARKLEKKLEKLRKKKQQQAQQKPKEKEKGAFGKLLEQRGIGGMISWISELAKIAGSMFGKIFRGIIIKQLDLYIASGGEDAAQAAINYGKLCAAVLPALSIILSGVKHYKRKVDIRPDFKGESIRAYVETRLVIFPIAVIGHALMALLKIILGEVKRQVREKMSESARQNTASETH